MANWREGDLLRSMASFMVTKLRDNNNRPLHMMALISFLRAYPTYPLGIRPPSLADIDHIARFYSDRFVLDQFGFVTLTPFWRQPPWPGDTPPIADHNIVRMCGFITDILHATTYKCERTDVIYFDLMRTYSHGSVAPLIWEQFREVLDSNQDKFNEFDDGYVYLPGAHHYSAAEWAEWEEWSAYLCIAG